MKLEFVSGCMADSLTVDGVEEIDLTDEQRLETIKKLLGWMKENPKPDYLNELLQFVLPMYGELETSDKPCEQCGDYVWTYMLDV